MVRLYITLLLTAIVLSINAQTIVKMDSLKTLKISERSFDFGTIDEKDGKVSHTFTVTNTGNTPIVISDVSFACSCISVTYTREPIRPFKSGEVTVTYNPAYRPGFFSKELNILTQDRKFRNRIWVKGNVKGAKHEVTEDYPYFYGNDFYMRQNICSFGPIKQGITKVITVDYINNKENTIKLDFIIDKGWEKLVSIVSAKYIKAYGKSRINLILKSKNTMPGKYEFYVTPVINGIPSKEKLKVRFTIQ